MATSSFFVIRMSRECYEKKQNYNNNKNGKNTHTNETSINLRIVLLNGRLVFIAVQMDNNSANLTNYGREKRKKKTKQLWLRINRKRVQTKHWAASIGFAVFRPQIFWKIAQFYYVFQINSWKVVKWNNKMSIQHNFYEIVCCKMCVCVCVISCDWCSRFRYFIFDGLC